MIEKKESSGVITNVMDRIDKEKAREEANKLKKNNITIESKINDIKKDDNINDNNIKTDLKQITIEKDNIIHISKDDIIKEDKEIKRMEQAEIDKAVSKALDGKEIKQRMEDAAKFSEQGVKNISVVKEDVNNLKGDVNNLNTNVNDLKSNINDLKKESKTTCNGIDCIKVDMKSMQDSQRDTNHAIKSVAEELNSKIESLKAPVFMCEKCGSSDIKGLSSFCHNCGSKIPAWNNKDGSPISGWKPYWERISHIKE